MKKLSLLLMISCLITQVHGSYYMAAEEEDTLRPDTSWRYELTLDTSKKEKYTKCTYYPGKHIVSCIYKQPDKNYYQKEKKNIIVTTKRPADDKQWSVYGYFVDNNIKYWVARLRKSQPQK